MKRLLLSLTLLAALPVLANATLFTRYEAVRKSFLASSFKDVQKGAVQLAKEARAAKQADVATKADAVAKAADLDAARVAFAELSTGMIELRKAAAKSDRPSVYHCPMIRKSWLQPKGEVGNPYDASMITCGAIKEE